MEESFLNDTTFWYGVAAVLCFVLIYRVARKAVVAGLDAQIAKVVAELEEAKRLRAEADATLKDYKARQSEAMKEAEEIVAKAKDDAARLRDETKEELKKTLERQEQIALEHIRLVQEEAKEEVRSFIVGEALTELEGKLAKHAKTPEATKIVDEVIAHLPKLVPHGSAS